MTQFSNIRSARTRATNRIRDYRVVFLDQIDAAGTIEYAFAMGVYDERSNVPEFFVTSERNHPKGLASALKSIGIDADALGRGASKQPEPGESHFLCVFNPVRNSRACRL